MFTNKLGSETIPHIALPPRFIPFIRHDLMYAHTVSTCQVRVMESYPSSTSGYPYSNLLFDIIADTRYALIVYHTHHQKVVGDVVVLSAQLSPATR